MQSDGNLVLYRHEPLFADDGAVWASGSIPHLTGKTGHGVFGLDAQLLIQDNGALAVKSIVSHTVLWTSAGQ
jgi:hypothetical protein